MSRNIFTPSVSQHIIQRAQGLQKDAKPLWGSMTATEMLLHCNEVNSSILQSKPATGTPTLKQRLLTVVGLSLLPRLTKGIKNKSKVGHVDGARDVDFDTKKQRFADTIARFTAHPHPIVLKHPVFGVIGTRKWGRFTYMHMDHHLRQFGV